MTTNINQNEFYSDEMVVKKDFLIKHHLKLTYQTCLMDIYLVLK